MSVMQSCTYNPATEKVVPKGSVVLDPEHPSIRYFIGKWVDVLPGEASGIETTVGAARYLSQQIEAQAKPPRIPEPGLWGVVESTVTYEGTTYSTSLVRHPGPGTANCWLDRSGSWFSWDDLIDPVLIREGVE